MTKDPTALQMGASFFEALHKFSHMFLFNECVCVRAHTLLDIL